MKMTFNEVYNYRRRIHAAVELLNKVDYILTRCRGKGNTTTLMQNKAYVVCPTKHSACHASSIARRTNGQAVATTIDDVSWPGHYANFGSMPITFDNHALIHIVETCRPMLQMSTDCLTNILQHDVIDLNADAKAVTELGHALCTRLMSMTFWQRVKAAIFGYDEATQAMFNDYARRAQSLKFAADYVASHTKHEG